MNSRARYQNLLRLQGCSENIVEHCTAVSKKALELADALTIPVNRDLVFAGAMLHDVGRCRTHDIEHVIVGAEIAREEGLSEDVANMIEKHIGAGITKKEAEALGLPSKD
ncbi:MAG: HDIG domain-containing metalloprotein, partial [Candidatus Hydrothermarchaeales archaeon]